MAKAYNRPLSPAYDRGWNAYEAQDEGNPYGLGTFERSEWNRGYEDAAQTEADYNDGVAPLPENDEPDLDPMYEHDSSMESAGWGTDEDYGYYGGDEYDC